jgi:hypothetical protein
MIIFEVQENIQTQKTEMSTFLHQASNIAITGGSHKADIDCTSAKNRHISLVGDHITINGIQLRGGSVPVKDSFTPAPPPLASDLEAALDPYARFDRGPARRGMWPVRARADFVWRRLYYNATTSLLDRSCDIPQPH